MRADKLCPEYARMPSTHALNLTVGKIGSTQEIRKTRKIHSGVTLSSERRLAINYTRDEDGRCSSIPQTTHTRQAIHRTLRSGGHAITPTPLMQEAVLGLAAVLSTSVFRLQC